VPKEKSRVSRTTALELRQEAGDLMTTIQRRQPDETTVGTARLLAVVLIAFAAVVAGVVSVAGHRAPSSSSTASPRLAVVASTATARAPTPSARRAPPPPPRFTMAADDTASRPVPRDFEARSPALHPLQVAPPPIALSPAQAAALQARRAAQGRAATRPPSEAAAPVP
jgi:hypothetical protein